MGKRVALINNDPALLAALHVLLAEAGYDPHVFRGVLSTLEHLRVIEPHAIVLDIPLKQPATSWELLAGCKLDPLLNKIPVIVCSADTQELQDQAASLRGHGFHILPKPFEPADLLGLLGYMLT